MPDSNSGNKIDTNNPPEEAPPSRPPKGARSSRPSGPKPTSTRPFGGVAGVLQQKPRDEQLTSDSGFGSSSQLTKEEQAKLLAAELEAERRKREEKPAKSTQSKSDEATVNENNSTYAALDHAATNGGNQEEGSVPIARGEEEVGVQYTKPDFGGGVDEKRAVNQSGINTDKTRQKAPPERTQDMAKALGAELDKKREERLAESTQPTPEQSIYVTAESINDPEKMVVVPGRDDTTGFEVYGRNNGRNNGRNTREANQDAQNVQGVTADAVNINRQGQEEDNLRFSPEKLAELAQKVNEEIAARAIRRQGQQEQKLSSGYVTFPQEQGPTRVTGDVQEGVVGQSQGSKDPNGRLNLGVNLGGSSSTEDEDQNQNQNQNQNQYDTLDETHTLYAQNVQTEGQKTPAKSTYVESNNVGPRNYEQPVPQNRQNRQNQVEGNANDTDYAVTNQQLSQQARNRSDTTIQHVGVPPKLPPKPPESSSLNRDSSKIFSDIVGRVPSSENQIISNENLQEIISDLKQHSELESKNPLLSEFANAIAILADKKNIDEVTKDDITNLSEGELKVLFDSFDKASKKKSKLESSISQLNNSQSRQDLEAIFDPVDEIIDKEASLNFLEEAEKGMKNLQSEKSKRFEERSKKVEEESKNFVQQKFNDYDLKQQNQSQTQDQNSQNNQSPEDWTQNITRSGVKKAAAVVGTAALFATGFGVLALIAGAILYGVMKSKDKGANVDDAMSKVLPKNAFDAIKKGRDMITGRSGAAQIPPLDLSNTSAKERRDSEYTSQNLSEGNNDLNKLRQMSLLEDSGLGKIAGLLKEAQKSLKEAESVSKSTTGQDQQPQQNQAKTPPQQEKKKSSAQQNEAREQSSTQQAGSKRKIKEILEEGPQNKAIEAAKESRGSSLREGVEKRMAVENSSGGVSRA